MIMQTFLYLHKEDPHSPQAQHRECYLLKHVDYEFDRTVGRRGEITSDIRGGEIRVAIEGFADHTLLRWLFDPMRKEDGEIVIQNDYEQNLAKFQFRGASAMQFRLHYDSRLKESVTTILTIRASEIVTDNDLHFEKR